MPLTSRKSRWTFSCIWVGFYIWVGCLCFPASVHIALAAGLDVRHWTKYWDPDYGFSLRYPGSLFEPVRPHMVDIDDGRDEGKRFLSNDGEVMIWVWGALNISNKSVRAYRDEMLRRAEKIGQVTYKPMGETWFVLSGYSKNRIFYRKVIFTCGNYIVNSMHVEYPVALRRIYDPVLEKIEDHFRTGRGAYTPLDCE